MTNEGFSAPRNDNEPVAPLVAASPSRVGTHVCLRPIAPGDLEFLYDISVAEENSFRWRFRGAVPERADFVKRLSSGVLVQFLVERRATKDRIGLVSAYGANLRDGWTYVAALSAPGYRRSGAVMDAMATFVDYVFTHWPFRKVYFETLEFNYVQFQRGIESFATEEGRFRRHIYFGDRYWDFITGAIYRDVWLRYRESSVRKDEGLASGPLGISEFCGLAARELGLDEGQIDADARLIDDLNFDSLTMMEFQAVIAGLVGDVDFEMIGEVLTMRDAWTWYSTALSMPRRSELR